MLSDFWFVQQAVLEQQRASRAQAARNRVSRGPVLPVGRPSLLALVVNALRRAVVLPSATTLRRSDQR